MPIDGAHRLNLKVESFEHDRKCRANLNHGQRSADAHAWSCAERQVGVSGRRDRLPAFRNKLVGVFVDVRSVMGDVLTENDRGPRIQSDRPDTCGLNCDPLRV